MKNTKINLGSHSSNPKSLNTTKIRIIIIGLNEALKLKLTFERLKSRGLIENTIFIDSKSEDNSIQICKEYEVDYYVLPERRNASIARAEGASKVTADWIVFLDGDVVPSEEFISRLININESLPEVWFGWKKDLSSEGRVSYHTSLKEIRSPDFLGGNFVIKSDVYRLVGGWNRNLFADEERHLLARLYEVGAKVIQYNFDMGDHINDKKSKRSFKEKYFGTRAVAEVDSFLFILKNNPVGFIFVYKYAILMLVASILFALNAIAGIVLMLYVNKRHLHRQPGKILIFIKILYWPIGKFVLQRKQKNI